MIEDPHGQTRAILWCLADFDPGMPLIEALGYLRTVEARLEVRRLEDKKKRKDEERRSALASMYRGSAGVADMVKDFAGDARVRSAAKTGNKVKVAEVLKDATGCSKIVAQQAATSLVGLLYEDPDVPF